MNSINLNDLPIELAEFLSDNNCLSEFLSNCNKYMADNKPKYGQLTNLDEMMISYAFNWRRTPQGCEYWANISYKWLELWRLNPATKISKFIG